MPDYRVEILASAKRYLDRLTLILFQRVMAHTTALGEDPRPAGAQKMSGAERYRIRVGDYRIIYKVDDASRVVTVTQIGHRRDVYRKLR
jgi:mRNA interferase RelE/StbE